MARLWILLLRGYVFPRLWRTINARKYVVWHILLRMGKTMTKCLTFAFKLKSEVPVWVWTSAEQSTSEFIIAGKRRLAANYTSKLKTIQKSQWGQKRSINYPETKTLPLCIIQRKDQYTFASQTLQPILLAYQQTSKQALSHGQLFKSALKLLAL